MTGALVEHCEPLSAAYEAGIREGDRVIAIDGIETKDVIDVNFHAANESFEVKYVRDGIAAAVTIDREYGEFHGMVLEDPPIRECVNFCPFCFVDQGPKTIKLRKGLEIKDDDYRYSFLYGHYVTLTNLSKADMKRIEEMRLSPLYVSVHATDPLIRAKLLGRPKSDPMPVLKKLCDASIELHTQIVMIRGLNDGDVMKQTIEDLYALEPMLKTVAIVPVGLTSHHVQGVARWTRETVETALAEIIDLGKNFPTGFVQAADEWFSILGEDPPADEYYGGMAIEENGVGMVRRMLDEWASFKLPKRIRKRSALVITGKSPEIFLQRIVGEMNSISGADVELRAVANSTYGPATTVTGLLAWRDIAPEIAKSDKEIVHIPDVMLSGLGRFLDDVTIEQARMESGRNLCVTATSAEGLYSIIAS